MKKETFEQWHERLTTIGLALPADQLEQPSPWVDRSIRQSLRPENEECWLDRYAAGYSPNEAIAEAISGA